MNILLRNIISTLILLGSFTTFWSQEIDLDTCITYKSIELALKNPDEVFILDLSKKGYKTFPVEVLEFKNLRSLSLAKNKLHELPDNLTELSQLEELSVGKNYFKTFPIVITKLENLKKIHIDQNEITAIPHDINKLQKLELLDMWSNDLYIVPESISELKNLKTFDLRVIQMNKEEQERIQSLLPNTKVHFSNSCNCAH